jgi:HlyD family secretion protein
MTKRTKLITAGLVVVAIIAIAAAASASRRGGGVQVRVEPATERDLVAIVSASGWIEPHRKVDVQADIMGRITQLAVVEGQQVTRGQILLRIDPLQYEAAVQRARAAVSEAQSREAQSRANLLQSERALERQRGLAAQDPNLVSRQAIEEAETQVMVQLQLLEAAGFGVAQARAALGEAEDRLSKTIIRAPMDGIVTRLNVEEGETAIVGTMNNAGSLLLTVADLSTMQAVVRVDETDMPKISIGDSASLQIDAFPRQTFSGRVTEISHSSTRPPASAAQTGATGQAVDFEIKITMDSPPPSLRSDLSTTAEVVTARRTGALSIPIIALTVRDRSSLTPVTSEDPRVQAVADDAAQQRDEEGVFVVRAGKAVFVPVDVGIVGRGHFEVLTGLVPGDSVVAGPYEAIRSLSDGANVRPLQTPAATPARGAAAAQAATGN